MIVCGKRSLCLVTACALALSQLVVQQALAQAAVQQVTLQDSEQILAPRAREAVVLGRVLFGGVPQSPGSSYNFAVIERAASEGVFGAPSLPVKTANMKTLLADGALAQ